MKKSAKKAATSRFVGRLRRLGVPLGTDGRLYAPWRDGKAGTRLSPPQQRRLLEMLEREQELRSAVR